MKSITITISPELRIKLVNLLYFYDFVHLDEDLQKFLKHLQDYENNELIEITIDGKTKDALIAYLTEQNAKEMLPRKVHDFLQQLLRN